MSNLRKFETVVFDDTEILVDLTNILTGQEVMFNSTNIAKKYGKRINNYLRSNRTKEYIKALEKMNIGAKKRQLLITIEKKGEYRGSWLSKELALDFFRFLSPELAVFVDKWLSTYIQEKYNKVNKDNTNLTDNHNIAVRQSHRLLRTLNKVAEHFKFTESELRLGELNKSGDFFNCVVVTHPKHVEGTKYESLGLVIKTEIQPMLIKSESEA